METNRATPALSEQKQQQLATLLGVFVGAGLDIGLTASEIASALTRKKVLAVADIVRKPASAQ